ncbi:hypothetical protein [Streptomyces sp. TRM68367]|uniref:hypothetical protein n=1 Tax=Streptomyces sp. TRM68367 TaxID=2758415 RepID=UPI0021CF5018|nr:hypothetical protein [Streptomyces sp. TRM68367]
MLQEAITEARQLREAGRLVTVSSNRRATPRAARSLRTADPLKDLSGPSSCTMTAERFARWNANLRRFVDTHDEASALERLVPGMNPSQAVEDIDIYRGFDGGPTTADVADLLVVRVPRSDDPLPAVQDAVTNGASVVALVDEGDRAELAVLAEAAAPGLGVRLHSGADWDRLSR